MELSVRKMAISNITGLQVGERDGIWVVKDGEDWRSLTAQEELSVQPEYDRLYHDLMVPKVITMRQARLALNAAGLLGTITQSISSMPMEVQIEWEYTSEVLRDSPTIKTLQIAMGLSDIQVDQIFIDGSKL